MSNLTVLIVMRIEIVPAMRMSHSWYLLVAIT